MATLETVSAEDLRQILAEVDDAAATQRLMAAITYPEIDGLTQAEAASLYGFSSSWASKWFNRLERLVGEPFEEVVYDKPRSGRPSELSDEEHERLVDALHHPPEDIGVDAPAWTVTTCPAVPSRSVRRGVLSASRPSIDVQGRAVVEDSPAGVSQG